MPIQLVDILCNQYFNLLDFNLLILKVIRSIFVVQKIPWSIYILFLFLTIHFIHFNNLIKRKDHLIFINFKNH